MKILDPCSATLTLSEVHAFLSSADAAPKPEPPVKRGAYPPVNLHGYDQVTRDLQLYIARSAPHVLAIDAEPGVYISRILRRFQERGIVLTKGEVMGCLDLGIGVKKTGGATIGEEGGVQIKSEDGEGEEEEERDDYTLLTAVVEEAESRFSDDQLTEILAILREEMPLRAAGQGGNGSTLIHKSGVAVATTVPVDNPRNRIGEIHAAAANAQAEMMDEGVENDEGEAEDETLLHEEGFVRRGNDGDIDGED